MPYTFYYIFLCHINSIIIWCQYWGICGQVVCRWLAPQCYGFQTPKIFSCEEATDISLWNVGGFIHVPAHAWNNAQRRGTQGLPPPVKLEGHHLTVKLNKKLYHQFFYWCMKIISGSSMYRSLDTSNTSVHVLASSIKKRLVYMY